MQLHSKQMLFFFIMFQRSQSVSANYQTIPCGSTSEWCLLRRQSDMLQLKVVNLMASRGDCQYEVIRVALGLTDSTRIMREKVAAFIEQNPGAGAARAILDATGNSRSLNNYVNGIRAQEFGDHSTLTVLCEVYSFDYTIISHNGDIIQSIFNHPQRVYLGFMQGEQHYVRLQPKVSLLTTS